MVVEFTTTYATSAVPVTTNVASSNTIHGEVYSIQKYLKKFVSDLRWVSLGTPVSCTNKTDRHDITEILLNVALNTITLTLLIQGGK
jgi:hypothetical protein